MALVVRAAMHDGVGHGLQDTAVDGGLPVRFENAADSAHGVLYRDGGSHQSHYRQTFVNFLTTPHHGVDRKLLPDAAARWLRKAWPSKGVPTPGFRPWAIRLQPAFTMNHTADA